MRLIKFRYHLIILAFSIAGLGLSKCATEVEENNTILLATNARPLRDIKFEATEERIKRGEYLANGILMCMTCHSPRDTTKPGFPPIESKKGSGAILYDTEEERLVVPNITPDKETGAGNWTDDMLSRAIREGVGHDGRVLSLPMYSGSFRQLSDEDLASVVVYLRTIPPVKNKLPKRRFSAKREKELQGQTQPLLTAVAAPDLSNMVTRGKYYIKTGHCSNCHSRFDKRIPGYFGGGNKTDNYYNTSYTFSSNITPHETGLKGWTPELFINVIRTGKGGVLAPKMPWAAYKNMTDEDLTAVFMVLQKLHPVNHKVVNGIKETYCEVCEMSHGYGENNKIIPPKAVPFNKALYPDFVGTYTHPEEGWSYTVTLERDKLLISEGGPAMVMVPIADNRFEVSGYPTPVGFRRDEKGKVKWLIEYLMEEDVLVKQEMPNATK
jgi:mono/diheme cytochrome c family protein